MVISILAVPGYLLFECTIVCYLVYWSAFPWHVLDEIPSNFAIDLNLYLYQEKQTVARVFPRMAPDGNQLYPVEVKTTTTTIMMQTQGR